MENIKDFFMKNKFRIAIAIIFVLGISVRLYGITELPYGFNQDEASAGYETFCLLTTGMDRKRRKFPNSFYFMGKWTECTIFVLDVTFCSITWIKCIFC